jgi:hypothetical protein
MACTVLSLRREGGGAREVVMDWMRRIKLLARTRLRLAATLALIAGVGIAIGLALFHYAGDLVERCVAAVLTSALTYFLIERDLRRRERAVDTRLLSTMASVRRRLREFIATYFRPHPSEETLIAEFSRCRSREDEKTAFAISRAQLADWMRGNLQLQSYTKAAIHRIEQLRELAQSGSTLAGNASPRVGAAFVDLAGTIESVSREPLWHMYRGVRGWERLLVLMTVVAPNGEASEEISEAVCAIAAGLMEFHIEFANEARHFLLHDLSDFRGRLPRWARVSFDEAVAVRDADDDDATRSRIDDVLANGCYFDKPDSPEKSGHSPSETVRAITP